jgi:glycerol-1-phosphate dehydrogenase [NAD(P)+]
MDGYASMGSALMNQGIKMTYEVNMPNDLIVDLSILKQAPSPMIASGFGDIIGKYTSLADWQLSNIINGEMIHQESYQMMEKALRDTINAYDSLLSKEDLGIELLTDALITAGTSMALCTNSRPASGSEHHISHYLEMEFIKEKKTVPLHGFKVALGSMVILDLYRLASFKQLDGLKRQKISELIKTLPTSDEIRQLLAKIGAPLRFNDIGVSRELLKSTLLKAYLVRNRFTILTWMSNDEDYLTYCDLLVEKYL